MNPNQEGIIITFPVQFLHDISPLRVNWNGIGVMPTKKEEILSGFKQCIRQIEWVIQEPDERWWWHSIGTKPTAEVLFAYITILNQIRYRANIVAWEPGGVKEFNDGRKLTAKHWLQLAHFVPAPKEIIFKGCQGFRYTEKIF